MKGIYRFGEEFGRAGAVDVGSLGTTRCLLADTPERVSPKALDHSRSVKLVLTP